MRRWWVRPWIQRRDSLGVYGTLLQELKADDIEELTSYLRMSAGKFEELFLRLEGKIAKRNTRFYLLREI